MAELGWAGALAVAALAVSQPACLSPVPLDPAPQADLDPRIVGAWRCVAPEMDDEDMPLRLTIARGRERMYTVEMDDASGEPDRFEAHASVVDGRVIVNVRDVSPTAGAKPWDFAEYALLRPDVLEIRMNDYHAFEAVQPTPAALRARAAQPGAFKDFCVCVRQKEKD